MSRSYSGILRIFAWAICAVTGAAAVSLLPPTQLLLVALLIPCIALLPVAPFAMLVIVLVLAPMRTLIATESGFALPLDIGQFLLLLYLSLEIARRIIRRQSLIRVQKDPVLFATLGLIVVFAIGAWNAISLSNWLTEWLKWVVIALLIWLLAQSAGANWRWLVFALLLSAVANAIVGLYIFFGGSGADHLMILGRFFRAFGTFGQPNPFGGFMGIALPIGLMGTFCHIQLTWSGFRRHRKISWRHIGYLAAFGLASLLIFAALIASWSRGAWLGIAVSTAVLIMAWPRRLSYGIALALGTALLFAGLWFTGLLPDSIVARLGTAASDLVTIRDVRGINFSPTNYAVVERLAHWQAAIDMARDKPIFGVGLGGYALAYEDYRLINWEQPLGHAHNYYLNLLAETGIVGLAAYLAFWLYITKLTLRLRRNPDNFARAIGIGLLGSWVYIGVHSVFDNLYVNNLFLHIGVLLSLLAILYWQTRHSLRVE